jgi:exonuclease SbcD
MADPVRILFLADTHLGFDLPLRPQVERRRRGHDFQANYERALAPALAGEVDVVVHGGDVFHRSRVPTSLAWQGLQPLVRVAERGVPVYVVPGNHERSRIPHRRFVSHPLVHVFDRPRLFETEVRGVRLRVAGFPFQRGDVRTRFPALLRETGWRAGGASLDVLCLHQCVEGATVGPSDFTFTSGRDVVCCRDLPAGFAAVLSGHIHRHQVLTRDLSGAALPAPVLYPGSVERTSLAEKGERKGFLRLELRADAAPRWRFEALPARPMEVRDVEVGIRSAAELEAEVRALIEDAPPEAVLRIRLHGDASDLAGALGAGRVRGWAPARMNVEIRPAGPRPRRRQRAPGRRSTQVTLDL